MTESLRRGLVAGAAGTAALNLVTYLDMAIRGRPPSQVPERTAGRLADRLDLPWLKGDDEATRSRRSAYGVVRGSLRVPWGLAAAVLAATTLLVGEGSAVRLGVTDWSSWSPAEWLADLVPRATYGAVTALTLEALQ